MKIPVKIETFEGPLDLLLHLIEKNKIEITDIPIVEITEQYLFYIDQMKEEKLNIASEFLIMAAELLYIKSKILLPKEEEIEDEEDPRDEIVNRLIEYKMFKNVAMDLKNLESGSDYIMYKEEDIPEEIKLYKEPINLDEMFYNIDLEKLNTIFNEVINRKFTRIDPIRSKFGDIEKDPITIEEKEEELENLFISGNNYSFKSLLSKEKSKINVIITFLVILEFIKLGKVIVEQNNNFSDILINVI